MSADADSRVEEAERRARDAAAELLEERALNMRASGIEAQRTADAEDRIRRLEALLRAHEIEVPT